MKKSEPDWNRRYALVLLNLAVLIVLFTLLTKAFE